MEILLIVLQLIIALGILNVWLLRRGRSSPWRGGGAENMEKEFAIYGLPKSVMIVVGIFKVTLAVLLIVGIWVPAVVRPAAIGLGLLMLGAVGMHVKAGDRPKKSLPAATLLILCAVVAILAP